MRRAVRLLAPSPRGLGYVCGDVPQTVGHSSVPHFSHFSLVRSGCEGPYVCSVPALSRVVLIDINYLGTGLEIVVVGSAKPREAFVKAFFVVVVVAVPMVFHIVVALVHGVFGTV